MAGVEDMAAENAILKFCNELNIPIGGAFVYGVPRMYGGQKPNMQRAFAVVASANFSADMPLASATFSQM